MVSPTGPRAPEAHEATPEDVKAIYNEARSVVGLSPRAAAGLPRLALEQLLSEHLKRTGQLDAMIASLVEDGLITRPLGRNMDALRLSGNGGVHVEGIRLGDDAQDAGRLFEVINAVVGQTVGVDDFADRVINSAPPGGRERVDKRHGPPEIPQPQVS